MFSSKMLISDPRCNAFAKSCAGRHLALIKDDVQMLVSSDPVLPLDRRLDGVHLRSPINTAGDACVFSVSEPDGFGVIEGHGAIGGELAG